MFERVFKLSEHKTTVKTEVMAGITTFMTMAYILAVNPSVLGSTGMDTTAVLLATALASCLGTLCMAFMANLPFALSAGMGLNAFMAYTVVAGYGYSWQVALLAVFIEGLIFIVLSLTNIREAIFNAIPLTLKKGCFGWYRSVHCLHWSAELRSVRRLRYAGRHHQLPGEFPHRRHLRTADADRPVLHRSILHPQDEGRHPVRHSADLDPRHALSGDWPLRSDAGRRLLFPVPELGA